MGDERCARDVAPLDCYRPREGFIRPDSRTTAMTKNGPPKKDSHGGLSEELKLANRLTRVSSDMDEVLNYLMAHRELLVGPAERTPKFLASIMHALICASIVSYSRGFIKSESEGRALRLLDFDSLPVAKEDWGKKLHKIIIDRRHQAVAHSDWIHHNTSLVPSESPVGGTLRVRSIPNVYADINIDQFLELARKVKGECDAIRFDIDRQFDSRGG